MPKQPSKRVETGIVLAIQIFIVVAFLFLWQYALSVGWANVSDISSPRQVLDTIVEWLRTGFVWPHLAETMTAVLIGYLIGTAAGLSLAFLMFFHRPTNDTLEPFIALLNAVPRSVLAPLVVIMLGIGGASKIALVAMVLFLITTINLNSGLRTVDKDVVNNARVLGASVFQLLRQVYVPASLVWIISSMRVGIGRGFVTCIVVEFFGSRVGIGWIISVGQETSRPEWMMGGLFFASVAIMIVDRFVLQPVEMRYSKWRAF